LTRLDLNHNSLLILPDEIGQLTRLEYLNLESNELNSLPYTLQNLHHLDVINIKLNKMVILPTYMKMFNSRHIDHQMDEYKYR
jgi:Leucine-rich repeat (LRR) protein